MASVTAILSRDSMTVCSKNVLSVRFRMVGLQTPNSRIYMTKKVFSKEAVEVSSAIISMLSGYKDVCHTIKFDNGGEFSEHRAIAEALEAETYFAHPYASHERGLNENTNGLLRQFIPKGTGSDAQSNESSR